MKLEPHIRFILGFALGCFSLAAGTLSFQSNGSGANSWTTIFGAVGITAGDANASIQIFSADSTANILNASADRIVIVQGFGSAAASLGFKSKPEKISIRQISDVHAPKASVIWEQPVTVPAIELPDGFQVFASERWKNSPVLAGKRTAHGAILWLATDPGPSGFERYPYLLQALSDLGLSLPLRSTSLWAFFDSSYRLRADVDYLAHRWRQAGIGSLHVAAWHNMEPDPAQDEYLRKLIEACHRNSILVYAWLELPHVSERFWADHPRWREKTALGQDAQLDWRKLMNLQNADCQKEIARLLTDVLNKFDWDGVNLAELYFESLEGASNPARFTPMNDDIRAEFKTIAGFDPELLFDPTSSYSQTTNPAALRKFLDFRAVLASRLQSEWLKQMEEIRKTKPYLNVVLTQIDDRFDSGIRDKLGADTARSLSAATQHKSALLVEDPATLWNLGPERYTKLAEKYDELKPETGKLAIDINVVERYQDVYPTKKQTGVELFELVHQAAESFSHVALYFENSLEKVDLSILPAAATTAKVSEHGPDELDLQAREQTRVAWQGPVEVDGKLWPVQNSDSLLAPAGQHRLSPGVESPGVVIADFNGEIRSAIASKDRTELAYRSEMRALATLASRVSSIEVDGVPFWKAATGALEPIIVLPAGQHVVTFNR